jgi:hypothetical protein
VTQDRPDGTPGDTDGQYLRIDDPRTLKAGSGQVPPAKDAATAPGPPATGEGGSGSGDDGPRLPDVPGKNSWADTEVDLEKARYEARLQVVVQQWRDQVEERSRTEERHRESERRYRDAGLTVSQAAFQAYLDAAKETLARSLSRAELVVKSAAAVGTVYTAVLAVAFRGSGRPQLPAVALWPTVFLAASLFLAAIYVGFVNRPGGTARSLGYPVTHAKAASPAETDRNRAAATYEVLHARHQQHFVAWAIEPALRRAWALRTGIVCLGMGMLLLPLPFIAFSASQRRTIPVAACLLFAVVVAAVELLERWPDQAMLALARIEEFADAVNRGAARKATCLFAEEAEVEAFGDRRQGLQAVAAWVAEMVEQGARLELRDLDAKRDPAAPAESTVTWWHVELRTGETAATPTGQEGAARATIRNGAIIQLVVRSAAAAADPPATGS